jgi:hypothetical protein
VLVLTSWLPNMAFSLNGEAPKVFWYLARATAFASLSLLWVSMALGLSITNKMARLWPGAPAAFAMLPCTMGAQQSERLRLFV